MSRLPIEVSLETISESTGVHYTRPVCLFVGSQSEMPLHSLITMDADYYHTIPDSSAVNK